MESKIKYKIKWEREKKYILNGIGGDRDRNYNR